MRPQGSLDHRYRAKVPHAKAPKVVHFGWCATLGILTRGTSKVPQSKAPKVGSRHLEVTLKAPSNYLQGALKVHLTKAPKRVHFGKCVCLGTLACGTSKVPQVKAPLESRHLEGTFEFPQGAFKVHFAKVPKVAHLPK